jgi:hypothetical protein
MNAPGPDRDHQQPRAPSSRSDVPCSMDFRGPFNFSFAAEAEIFRWPFYKLQISVNVSLKKAQWIMLLTV